MSDSASRPVGPTRALNNAGVGKESGDVPAGPDSFAYERRLETLDAGDHLYLLYGGADERLAGLVPAVEEALSRGHRVLYFASEDAVDPVLEGLGDRGIDVEDHRERGSLEMARFEGRDLVEGALDPEALVSSVLEAADRARADGFPCVWWIGEVPWHLRSGVAGEQVQAFEAQLFDRLPGSRVVALCQFDRRRLSDELLSMVLEAHPLAVVGDQVYPNPFYLPPRAVLDEYETSPAEWKHRQLRRARKREERLAENERRLQTILERVPALIARFDADLRCVYANPRIEAFTGLTTEQRMGRTAEEGGLDSDAVRPWARAVRRALETGEEQTVVGPWEAPSGKRWLRTRILPEPGPDGAPESALLLAQDVTEERQARQRSDETAVLFRKTVSSLEEAVFVVQEDRSIIYCNPTAEEMFGYARSELVGETTRKIHVDKETFRRFGEESERVLRRGGSYRSEFRVRRKDGSTFPSEHVVTLLHPEEGLSGGVVSVVRDMSDRHRAREALETYAERLEHLRQLDRALLGARSEEALLRRATAKIRELLEAWRVTVILVENDDHRSLLRASSTEDQPVEGPLTDPTEPEARRVLRAVLESEDPVRVDDVSAVDQGGRLSTPKLANEGLGSWFAVSLSVEDRALGGLMVGFDRPRAFGEMTVEMAREMAAHLGLALRQTRLLERVDEATARRRAAEERADRMEVRLEGLLDTLDLGVVRTDLDGRIVDGNEALARILGYASPEELVGVDVGTLLVSPDWWSGLRRRLEEEGGFVREQEVKVRRKDGSTAWVAGPARSFRTPGGDEVVEGVIRDVTDRKRLEELVLRIGTEERKRIGRELHDQLGQKLSGIAFLAGTLVDRPEEDGEVVREIASEAREAVTRVRHLTRGLDPGELGEQGLADALGELAGEGRRLFGIDVAVDVDAEVALDQTEALHLYRIAQEAMTNAVRHGDARTVWIELRTEDGERVLEVRDDGVGMDGTPDDGGLGLRTMRYRCEAMGGTLAVHSEEGAGTRVRCCLPPEPAPAWSRGNIP